MVEEATGRHKQRIDPANTRRDARNQMHTHRFIKTGTIRTTVLFWLALSTCQMVLAKVKPNGLFTNGAVLQKGMTVPVWGTADEGEAVSVNFQGQTVKTFAKNGCWRVYLKPLTAGGPYSLTISGEDTMVVSNILVGEVWICSGQSNMQMPLAADTNAAESIAGAHDSQLRLFTVPEVVSDQPQNDVSGIWKETTPEAVKYFSAVAYYFGRDLRKNLNEPVGLILSSVGGTPGEAWTPHPVLEANPELDEILKRYQKSIQEFDQNRAEKKHEELIAKAKAAGTDISKVPAVERSPIYSHGRPSGLYNGMIAPLEPFAMAGVAWYQGEQNYNRSREYRTLFPALIYSWRKAWGEGDFPFLFVQIPPHKAMPPELREAQLLTWKSTPRTSMVVTTDVGDVNDIHPKRKEPVGRRLALAALALAYGKTNEYSGPVYDSFTVRGDRAIVSFTHIGDGLVASGNEVKGFTVAGEDGVFTNATALIEGDKVAVFNPSVMHPVSVRYGWANVPEVNLFNQQGLPATPFRTDVE